MARPTSVSNVLLHFSIGEAVSPIGNGGAPLPTACATFSWVPKLLHEYTVSLGFFDGM